MGLFGGNKKSSGGGSGGSGSGSGTTGGNPPGDNNNTNQNNTGQNISVQCNDAIDNDGDGWKDIMDYGCVDLNDTDESNNFTIHECSDGIDNNGNNLTDGQDIIYCSSWNDDSEGSEPPITGGNATYLVPGNGWNNQLISTPSANGMGPTPIAEGVEIN